MIQRLLLRGRGRSVPAYVFYDSPIAGIILIFSISDTLLSDMHRNNSRNTESCRHCSLTDVLSFEMHNYTIHSHRKVTLTNKVIFHLS